MAGYGGMQVAQDVDLPASPLAIQSDLAALQQQQAAAALASKTLPISVAKAQSQLTGLNLQNTGLDLQNTRSDLTNQQSALELAQAKQAAIVKASQLSQAAIANVANDPTTTAANWDQRFKKLVDQGVQEAAPLVGQYSQALHDRIAKGYTPAGVPTGSAAVADQAGAEGISSGATPTDWSRMFANVPTPQLQQKAAALDDLDAAIQRVQTARDPAAQWAIEAPKFGYTQALDPAAIPAKIQELKQQIEPARTALHGWLIRQGAGLPAPTAVPQILNTPNGVVAVNPTAPGGPTAEPLTGLGAPSPAAANAITPAKFADAVMASENATGNPAARNPRSTATGDGQFVDKTWLDLMKSEHPELTKGKSKDEILALRTDRALSAEMTAAYAVQNGATLATAGQPVNATTLALSHKLGAGDALKVLGATPSTPLTTLLSPAIIRTNPQFEGQTAGGYVAGLAQKFTLAPVQIAGITPGMTPTSAGALAQSSDTETTATGLDFLKTLAPNVQTQVKALAEGRMQFPSGMALQKPYWQQMISAVGQYDPSFNQSDYNARSKTRAAFTSGKQAQNIASYNTAIDHLAQLDDAITDLGNTPLSWVNAPAQTLGSVVGDPHTKKAIATFNTKKGAAATELVNAFRGSGGAEADIQYWLKQFKQAESPDALHSVTQAAAHLLGSRITALQDEYNTGMGTSTQTVPGLSPTSVKALTRLQTGVVPTDTAAAAPPPPEKRVVGQVYQSPKGPVKWTGLGWVMASNAPK